MNPKESGISASFEEQFATREKFGKREINVLDLSPQDPKHTVLFFLGWNAGIDEYRKIFKRFYNSGTRVVVPELAGNSKQRAEDIRLLTISKSLRRVDVIAHSVGAISAVNAILQNPSLPSRMILINSASVMGEDDDKELIRRYSNLLNGRVSGDGQDSVGVRQVYEMAREINGFKMYERINTLRALGIKDIELFHSRDDTLFPYDRVKAEATRQGWNVSEISGGHLSLDEVDLARLGYPND